jgi:hypothetical protein
MTNLGFDKPLYILPFDHRGSFQKKMFGWDGALSAQQTAEIAAAKQVIYDAFLTAVHAGVPKDKAGILVDQETAPLASAAGARVLVAGSSIFGDNAGVVTAMSRLRASVAHHKSTLLD